jgi:hypothetical protein
MGWLNLCDPAHCADAGQITGLRQRDRITAKEKGGMTPPLPAI